MKYLHKVRLIQHFTNTTYLLRLSRENIKFKAGQHMILELEDDPNFREYSVYSSPKDNYIDFLIREIKQGYLSKKLKQLEIGDKVNIIGPNGNYNLPNNYKEYKFLFIATGTGIAPFHSFIKTYKDIDYKLLHGVRYAYEAYDKDFYSPSKYILCTSRDQHGGFFGRVTKYVSKNIEYSPEILIYLCGNYKMIEELTLILKKKGYLTKNIYAEKFFKF